MRTVFCIFTFVFFTSVLNAKTIGFLIPLQHHAMEKIEKGFVDQLQKLFPKATVKTFNANGEITIMQSILQQMKAQKMDLIVAIGGQATRTTLSLTKEIPVLGLATEITDAEREKLKPCNVVSLLDEIPAEETFGFLNTVIPSLKKFTLLYHNNEKITPEVEALKTIAKERGVEIQLLMVQTQAEAISQSKTIDSASQALVVLKDHIVVSTVSALMHTTHALKIPLIASDEGSVSQGADIAFGVDERSIGEEGAHIATKILQGEPACKLQNTVLSKKNIFFNPKHLSYSYLTKTKLDLTASQLNATLLERGI